MRLSDAAQGRDNNFKLLRMLAALAVVISHSFALALGSAGAEPLQASLGITPGSIGVDIFFITSGFLVTGSLLGRQDGLEFFWSRLLRIYPAQIVMVLLTVLVLGAAMTSLTLQAYFSKGATWLYLLKNSALFNGIAYTLPGVFADNPYREAVNGALWSLPYELGMYLILLGAWCLLGVGTGGRSDAGARRMARMRLLIVLLAAAAAIHYLRLHFPSHGDARLPQLFFMFFSGAAAWVLKAHIVLSTRAFLLGIVVLGLSTLNQQAFFLSYNLLLAYLLFYIVYVPGGVLRRYNQLGDYSYGLYIYAFPVQQAVAALIPQVQVGQMTLIAGAVALGLAVLSWHGLEEPVLRLKQPCLLLSRRLLARLAQAFMTARRQIAGSLPHLAEEELVAPKPNVANDKPGRS